MALLLKFRRPSRCPSPIKRSQETQHFNPAPSSFFAPFLFSCFETGFHIMEAGLELLESLLSKGSNSLQVSHTWLKLCSSQSPSSTDNLH